MRLIILAAAFAIVFSLAMLVILIAPPLQRIARTIARLLRRR